MLCGLPTWMRRVVSSACGSAVDDRVQRAYTSQLHLRWAATHWPAAGFERHERPHPTCNEVAKAEADCGQCRKRAAAAWSDFQQESALAATPRRVLVAGLVAGFVAVVCAGRNKSGSGSPVAGKLIEMLMDSAFATLGAAISAGAAAAAEEDIADDRQPVAGASRTDRG